MTKKQDKTIDLQGWLTQTEYARQTGYKLNTISQWVRRAKEGEGKQKIAYLDVEALGITLVKKLQ